jgi:hypothetical protein
VCSVARPRGPVPDRRRARGLDHPDDRDRRPARRDQRTTSPQRRRSGSAVQPRRPLTREDGTMRPSLKRFRPSPARVVALAALTADHVARRPRAPRACGSLASGVDRDSTRIAASSNEMGVTDRNITLESQSGARYAHLRLASSHDGYQSGNAQGTVKCAHCQIALVAGCGR